MIINLTHCIVFSFAIFVLSIVGIIINRKNLLILLMSIELMLLAVNTNFIIFSNILWQNIGSIFIFFSLTIASSEAAVGLSIVMILFKRNKNIDINNFNNLKG